MGKQAGRTPDAMHRTGTSAGRVAGRTMLRGACKGKEEQDGRPPSKAPRIRAAQNMVAARVIQSNYDPSRPTHDARVLCLPLFRHEDGGKFTVIRILFATGSSVPGQLKSNSCCQETPQLSSVRARPVAGPLHGVRIRRRHRQPCFQRYRWIKWRFVIRRSGSCTTTQT